MSVKSDQNNNSHSGHHGHHSHGHHGHGGVMNGAVPSMAHNLSTLTRNLRKKSKSSWSLRVKSPTGGSKGHHHGSEAAQMASALGSLILGNPAP